MARSDHGHRVDPNEVNKLAKDLKKLAMKQQKRRNGNTERYKEYTNQKSNKKNHNQNVSSTKHYGVF